MIKRILLAGDVHGNVPQIKYLYQQAVKFEVDAIIGLGDWGFWEHQKSGIYFLNYIESRAKATGIPCYFICGNHENHTLLRRRYMDRHDMGRDTQSVEEQLKFVEKEVGPWTPEQTEEGFWKIRWGLYYISRASVWEWNGVRFAALGGAFSVDINWRKSGVSWWPEETIEPEEVDSLRDVGKVDVFLSHDVPIEYNIQHEFAIRGGEYFKADQRTIRNRTLLSKAVEHTHPNHHYHGHYHINYKGVYTLYDGHKVEVMGLDRDGSKGRSYTIVDLTKDLN